MNSSSPLLSRVPSPRMNDFSRAISIEGSPFCASASELAAVQSGQRGGGLTTAALRHLHDFGGRFAGDDGACALCRLSQWIVEQMGVAMRRACLRVAE